MVSCLFILGALLQVSGLMYWKDIDVEYISPLCVSVFPPSPSRPSRPSSLSRVVARLLVFFLFASGVLPRDAIGNRDREPGRAPRRYSRRAVGAHSPTGHAVTFTLGLSCYPFAVLLLRR